MRSWRSRSDSPGLHLAALVFGLLMSASIAANIWLENDLAAQAPALEVTRGTVSSVELRHETHRDRATHERRLVVECSAPGTAGVVWFSDREVADHDDDGYDDLRRLARSPIVGALLPGGARGLDGARCTHLP